jgi:transcriptional regulator with XRE-family HTH domain
MYHYDEVIPPMGGDMSGGAGIGSRVRAARERLGRTREAVAFHSGLSSSAIAHGVRPAHKPSTSTLMALSRQLGVTIDHLVDGGQSPQMMPNRSAFPYRADDQFKTTMGSFLAEGVERSEALLAVTTGPKIELLREHLGGDARSVEFVGSSSFLQHTDRRPSGVQGLYRGQPRARCPVGTNGW